MTARTHLGILCVVCQDDARGRSCSDTTPSVVAGGLLSFITRVLVEAETAGEAEA
jgi:hypothetical protein